MKHKITDKLDCHVYPKGTDYAVELMQGVPYLVKDVIDVYYNGIYMYGITRDCESVVICEYLEDGELKGQWYGIIQ